MKFDPLAPHRLKLWLWLRTDYGGADGRNRFENVEEIRARLRLSDEQSRILFRVLAEVKHASVNARIRSEHRDRQQALHAAIGELERYRRWRDVLAADLRMSPTATSSLSHRITRTIDAMKSDPLTAVLLAEQATARRNGRPRKEWIRVARRELKKAGISRRDQDDLFEQIGATDRYAPRKTRCR